MQPDCVRVSTPLVIAGVLGVIIAGLPSPRPAEAAPPTVEQALAKLPPQIVNFESPDLPKGWLAGPGGTTEIVTDRYKSGARSLRWAWTRQAARLTCGSPTGPIAMQPAGGLAFWAYSPAPRERIIRLELLHEGAVIGSSWYVTNFKGWRPLGAPFAQVLHDREAFAPGKPAPRYDAFRLVAPSDPDERGELCLDYVNFRCPDQLRPDHQQPWVGSPAMLRTKTPHRFIYSNDDIAQNRPWMPPRVPAEKITAEEREGMRLLAASGPQPGPPAAKDDTVLRDLEAICRLRRTPSGTLSGRPIAPPMWGFNVPLDAVVLYEPTMTKALGRRGRIPLLTRLAGGLTHEMRARNKPQAERLRQAFIDLCDHYLEQGYADGCDNTSISVFPYDIAIAMRQELAACGRLGPMLRASIAKGTGFPAGVLFEEDYRGLRHAALRNTDTFGIYDVLLFYLPLLPDESERLQYLRAYQRMVSLICDPRLGEPYAWDGTVHHHMMFHPGYSYAALTAPALRLANTCFRPYPEALAIMRRSLLMLAFMSDYRGVIPANCPGYTGVPLGIYSKPERRLGAFPFLGTAESIDGIDRDLAGIFLAYHQRNPKPPDPYQAFVDQGIKPYRPVGHRSVNGAAISLHRRADWLVSIAGRHRFRRGIEPNYPGSLFNKYSRHGSVFVCSSGSPMSVFASGYSLEGWDSRHYPGSTSYIDERPAEILAASRGKAENVLGGGTTLDDDGIWGMNAVGQFYEPGTRWAQKMAKESHITYLKSAFCFDDRITLITTGVGRCKLAGKRDRELTLGTTLWQNSIGAGGLVHSGPKNLRLGFNVPLKPPAIPPEQEPIWVNGESIKEFPWRRTLLAGPARVLVDNKQTGYYVHPGSPPLTVTRRRQTWTYPCGTFWKQTPPNPAVKTDLANFDPTEGDFSTAWFEHGVKPEIGECVYTLIPQAGPERMTTFEQEMKSSDPPYRVLEKSDRAHVLRDRDSSTTGYVIFNRTWNSPTGVLRRVNRPCWVMIRETPAGLKLSVASTDLDSWDAEIKLSGEFELTLAGEWQTSSPDATARRTGGETRLTLPFTSFLPEVVELQRP